jgi:tetratricopeptide (TPR) repeat protein
LFVRFLMDDLLQAVKEGKSPEQVLERTPSGFSEYVKEQLDELERSEELEQQVGSKIWDLFALLTVAKGALRQDEVEALTEFSRRELKRLRHQVTRWFSIGKTRSSADMPTADMATYSFAHPLLAEEFRKHLEEARRMEERLLKWCENWREHPSFPYILRHYAEHLYEKCPMTNERMTNEQMTNYAELCRLALDSDFKQAQTQHLPDEPNLPLKTVQLALDAAIQLEDAPMMVRLLIEHAKRAQEETPLQAWRKGHRGKALELATDIVFKRDHELGTLWSLLLAWVAESEGKSEEERSWSKRFLDEVRKRWEGGKLEKLEYWQGEMAAFLLGELGQVEGAMEVVGLVLDDEFKRELATGWASKGLFDQALKVAEGIEKAWWRAEALREIAVEMAKTGMFDQALKVAEGIEDAEERARALIAIAGEMAKAGITDWAKEVFEQALKVVEGSEDAWQQAGVLREIMEGMAKVEMFVQDLKVLEWIGWAWWRAGALREIAEGMAKAGMTDWAKEVFEQALKVAEGIWWAWWRAKALGAIAEGMAKAGMVDQALKVAEGIEEEWDWERVLGEMARDARESAKAAKMVKAGEVERVVGIVEREMAVRTEGLPSVLSALAERASGRDGRSKEGFLKLLPLCGWSLEFAYKACGLLAWLYPERGEEIAGVIAATGD